MGTIISAYHEPTASVVAELPALQQWASGEGIAGTDFPWSWADFYRMLHDAGWLQGYFLHCPCCAARFEFQLANSPTLEHLYYLGQCPGCSIIWWW
jgi:hypothetical protein